ncbi:hypothetical protein VNO80_22879 [Phaseolus coccineus]|uniref:Uncharacterized protein n=1 Tax=Phaseolus coccineus TaxID=3886 RepID=A0AAN9M6L2_PHACN
MLLASRITAETGRYRAWEAIEVRVSGQGTLFVSINPTSLPCPSDLGFYILFHSLSSSYAHLGYLNPSLIKGQCILQKTSKPMNANPAPHLPQNQQLRIFEESAKFQEKELQKIHYHQDSRDLIATSA